MKMSEVDNKVKLLRQIRRQMRETRNNTSMKVKVKSLSHVRLFATPWTVVYQAPLSMGFFQARILEWVAMPSSKRSSPPRDWSHTSYVSCIAGGFFTKASLVAQTVKRLPAMRETRVRFLGREDPLKKAMGPHSSTLAWKNPMDRGAW